MRNALTAIAIIGIVILILPFALGLCAFRFDRFNQLEGQTEVEHPSISVSFSAIRCLAPRSSFPGALAPNDIANGFQVRWEFGNFNDSKTKLTISDVKADLIAGDSFKPLDVLFVQWEGEYNVSKNINYAFISTGGYASDLPLGDYHIRLSYIANGVTYTDSFSFRFTEKRKFGFHTFFYSHYY
jgi:hypothetical protein